MAISLYHYVDQFAEFGEFPENLEFIESFVIAKLKEQKPAITRRH